MNHTRYCVDGCSAHYLNLLAKDVAVWGGKEHIVQEMKYFRNGHLRSACYRAGDGKMLVMLLYIRWNGLADCFSAYLDN